MCFLEYKGPLEVEQEFNVFFHVKLHLKDERTDGRTDGQRLCPLPVRSVRPIGDEPRCFIEIQGRGVKIRDQPINRLNLFSWLSGKSLKLLPPYVTFSAKMHQILFPASVRPSLTWSLTLTAPRVQRPQARQKTTMWSIMIASSQQTSHKWYAEMTAIN